MPIMLVALCSRLMLSKVSTTQDVPPELGLNLARIPLTHPRSNTMEDLEKQMPSVAEECTQAKHEYERCFNQWYTNEFIKGSKKDPCSHLLKAYNKCLKVSHSRMEWSLCRDFATKWLQK
eukprot:m.46683 g.46683  ORF g.46683 m.46683 type:complete len:120 (-) comp10933_c0_seq5:157-516(-)